MNKKMLAWLMVTVFIVGAFQTMISIVGAINDPSQPADGETVYVVGDWTVQSNLEYHNCTIDVRGNLTIESGATLTLNNVTLRMNSSSNGEFGITVLGGGSFKVYKGTTITAVNGAFHFTFRVEDTATLDMDDATVSQCGVAADNDAERTALYINSDDVKINDTAFNNNAMGILVDSVGIELTNSSFKNNIGNGAYLWKVTAGTYKNLNLSNNGFYGMAVIFCEDILLENVSVTKNTNDGFGTYRSNFTMEKILSWKNNRLGILAQSSNITAWNSTFLGHNNWCDVYLTGHNQTHMTGPGHIELMDTLFNSYHLHDNTQSLNSSFSVNVSVIWWGDNTSIEDAEVTIFNNSDSSDGGLAYQGNTDQNGRIDDIWLNVIQEGFGIIKRNSPHTFRAEKDYRASEVEFNVSKPWHEVDVEIDKNPPVLVITSPAEGAIINYSEIKFEGIASDHDGVDRVIGSHDGINWVESETTENWVINFDLLDRVNMIEFQAFDTFGSMTRAFINITVDTVSPPIIIKSPIYNQLTSQSTIDIEGETEPGASIQSGGVNITNYFGDFYFNVALNEGANSFTLTATDIAGNSNSTSIIIRRDSVPPILNVTWPPHGFGTLLSEVEITGKVEGATNISFKRGNYYFDDVPQNNRFSQVVPIVEGENDIVIKAWDAAGNYDMETVTVIKDTTAPVLFVSWTGGNLTNVKVISIFISTEVGANVTVNGAQAENQNGTSIFIYELQEGLNAITVKTKDWLGNLNQTTFQIEADFTPPDVLVDSPVEGFIHASRLVNFFGTAIDDMVVTNVEISIDGDDWLNTSGTETWYYSTELDPGDHTVQVRARDLAGNFRTLTVNFSVLAGKGDTELPDIRITWPKEGSTVPTGSITFTGTAFDDTGINKVQWSKDGVVWHECNGTAYWSVSLDLKPDSHTIYFRAIDDAGKNNITSVSITVKKAKPKSSDNIFASGLGQVWVMLVLVLAIILVALYFVVMTARSKKAIEDEERMEREALEEDIEDDEAILGDDEDGSEEE